MSANPGSCPVSLDVVSLQPSLNLVFVLSTQHDPLNCGAFSFSSCSATEKTAANTWESDFGSAIRFILPSTLQLSSPLPPPHIFQYAVHAFSLYYVLLLIFKRGRQTCKWVPRVEERASDFWMTSSNASQVKVARMAIFCFSLAECLFPEPGGKYHSYSHIS